MRMPNMSLCETGTDTKEQRHCFCGARHARDAGFEGSDSASATRGFGPKNRPGVVHVRFSLTTPHPGLKGRAP